MAGSLRSLLCSPRLLLLSGLTGFGWSGSGMAQGSLGEQVSGLIYLDHLMHAYMFTEADRELVVAVANLMALGLQKANRPPV